MLFQSCIPLCAFLFVLSGCSPQAEEATSESRYVDHSAVVAQLGSIQITEADVQRHLTQLSPLSRSRYQNPERRSELLDTLIRFELLAGEARRQGHHEAPEVQLAYKQAMVRELLRHDVRELVSISEITDQQVEEHYQTHLSDYQRPELIKASHIVFEREEAAEASLKLLQLKIKAEPHQARALFGDLAAEVSIDIETKARRGDLQYFTATGELVGDHLFPQSPPAQEVASAAASLSHVGDLFPRPIQSSRGWHLIQKTGGKRAFRRTLDEVKPEIRNQLFRASKAKALEEYVEKLKSQTSININEEALQAIKVPSGTHTDSGPKISPLLPTTQGVPTQLGAQPRVDSPLADPTSTP